MRKLRIILTFDERDIEGFTVRTIRARRAGTHQYVDCAALTWQDAFYNLQRVLRGKYQDWRN